jgi:hypothetical protein
MGVVMGVALTRRCASSDAVCFFLRIFTTIFFILHAAFITAKLTFHFASVLPATLSQN